MTAPNAADAETRRWIENVVVGLNLCPFAKPVLANLCIEIFNGQDLESLTDVLRSFLIRFAAENEHDVPTAILVTPNALSNFEDYNDYLEVADQLIFNEELDGIIQIASFHPRYRFMGSREEDASNYSNRSPYPMFHLLREDHVSDAIEKFPNTLEIPERNVSLLREMGIDAVRNLRAQCSAARPNGGQTS